ncbi:DnaJ-domain-containing protein, partial [Ramicandelaber brevisporus]
MTSTKTIVNCYELLQVAEDCTAAVLASAYRRLALKHHPDRNRDDPTANDRFLQLRKAYDTLMDPVQRKEHDLALNSAREQQRRTESMDAERRRMRDELLKREQQASMASTVHEQQSHHKYGHMPQQYQQPWKQRRQQRRQ